MRLTIPHYYDFGEDRTLVGDDLVNPGSWDALRTRTEGPFALPPTRAEWDAVLDSHPELQQRGAAIAAWLGERDVGHLASYGVGGASIEGVLNRLRPDMELTLGEYAPATVARLGEVFPEADAVHHDLLADPPLEADMHLFHRIDTEFTNRQWRGIMERFRQVPVLLVATELVEDWARVMMEWRRRGGIRRRATKCGVIRSRDAFEALWRNTHSATRLQFNDLQAWSLEPLR
jgi:hypothetical protein